MGILVDSKQFYTNTHKKFKASWEQLGWVNKQRQLIRFKVLTHFMEPQHDLREESVLDVGCGHADLLDMVGLSYHYTGIDNSFESYEIANKKTSKRVTIVYEDFLRHIFLHQFDYVMASGTFNLNCSKNNPKELYKMIDKMFLLCRKQVAFNFLTDAGMAKESITTHTIYDLIDVFRYCLSITPCIVLIRNYLNYDATIVMYKNYEKTK